jgi:lactoylglutathione lyase
MEHSMKINHLNLSVANVPETARFFEEFFGFRCAEQKGRDSLFVLLDETGFGFTLSNLGRTAKHEYPRDFHIGFLQENKEQVEAIHQRLKAAGYVEKPPQSMHGSWGFYVFAPGGIQIEVSYPLEDNHSGTPFAE